ncbi:MAG: hydroxymethylglutaryl-CoA reductase, degradative [Vagococcus sp.]
MTSEFPKFYKKTRLERLNLLKEHSFLSNDGYKQFKSNHQLDENVANALIENQLTQFPLPLGVALNFTIDSVDTLIPMVVEEPSVIAACSNAAKIMRPNGFKTSLESRHMIGQIILTDIDDFQLAKERLLSHEQDIKTLANDSHPSIVKRGGGIQKMEVSIINNQENVPSFLTIYVSVDVKDAMGANIINTILEGITPFITKITDSTALMSILSNYNTNALVTATCSVHVDKLTTDSLDGLVLAKKIVDASKYAKLDSYRAATHNKGIMNGIDSVIIATGNDPRAVEAGAHAYASRNGQYEGLSNWWLDEQLILHGELTLPMAVGTVGGAISVLPMATSNLEMMGITHAEDLARVVVSVGLAQNFAALRALVSDGIQKGHMNLHASSLAIQVGAKEEEIDQLTNLLRHEPIMNSSIAINLLKKIRHQKLVD